MIEKKRYPNVCLMLAQRLRRWSNINQTSRERLVLAGIDGHLTCIKRNQYRRYDNYMPYTTIWLCKSEYCCSAKAKGSICLLQILHTAYFRYCILPLHWIVDAYQPHTGAGPNGSYHSVRLWLETQWIVNIAFRWFLHNHGNIATDGSPKPDLCPTLISNDFKGYL